MKKIVKSTLAVIALATLTSQAANAQSSTSKVNSRERILQVLDQSRPNEYVPAAFFLHFENKLGRKAVQDHKDFYRATNMDFVKVFYEISVPKIDIQSGKDWAKVPVYGEDFFEPQVAVFLSRKQHTKISIHKFIRLHNLINFCCAGSIYFFFSHC